MYYFFCDPSDMQYKLHIENGDNQGVERVIFLHNKSVSPCHTSLSYRPFAAIYHYQVFSSYSQQQPSMMWSLRADICNASWMASKTYHGKFAVASYITHLSVVGVDADLVSTETGGVNKLLGEAFGDNGMSRLWVEMSSGK
jgi:hypothetical protein